MCKSTDQIKFWAFCWLGGKKQQHWSSWNSRMSSQISEADFVKKTDPEMFLMFRVQQARAGEPEDGFTMLTEVLERPIRGDSR